MQNDRVTFEVRVRARAHTNEIVGLEDGRVVIRVCAPPVDDKANDALRRILSKAFGVSVSSVTLARGARGKNKTVAISLPARWPAVLAAIGVPPLPE